MLKANLVSGSIPVAKFEQVRAGQRPHFAFARIDFTINVRLAVGGIENFSITGDSRRLCKTRFCKQAIAAALASITGKHANDFLVQIQLPNLMWTGHRDIEVAPDQLPVPRRIQIDVAGRTRFSWPSGPAARAGDRLNGMRLQTDATN